MGEQTLKDLLKPPFRHAKAFKSIDDCDGNALVLLSHRITFWDNKELECELKSFICAALNEKWERDFGESLKWKLKHYKDRDAYLCPKCNVFFKDMWDYCPNCGQKLDSPEEKT